MLLKHSFLWLSVLLGVSPFVLGDEEPLQPLIVLVNGASPQIGQIVLSVFDSEDNFLETPLLSNIKAADDQGGATFIFSGLKPGAYAISAYYDADSNSELNTNFFGIPSELVGFSNNAKGSFGPPSYEQVKVNYPDKQKVQIQLTGIGN